MACLVADMSGADWLSEIEFRKSGDFNGLISLLHAVILRPLLCSALYKSSLILDLRFRWRQRD